MLPVYEYVVDVSGVEDACSELALKQFVTMARSCNLCA